MQAATTARPGSAAAATAASARVSATVRERHLRGHAPLRHDADLRQPRLDRDPVPDRPSRRLRVRVRAARGLRSRHRQRLRAGDWRTGVREPSHRPGARPCRQRDRRGARLAGAAGDRRRSARSRAIGHGTVLDRPRPRTPRRQLPGVGHNAGAPPGSARLDRTRMARGPHRPRAGARDRSDGRLGGGRRPGCRRRSATTRAPNGRRSGGGRGARRPDRGCALAGARRRRRACDSVGAGLAPSRSPSASAARSGRRRSRPRRLPAGPSAVGGAPAVAALADARDARRPTIS